MIDIQSRTKKIGNFCASISSFIFRGILSLLGDGEK